MGRFGRVLPEVMVHYHCHHYHGQLGFRSSKPLRSAPLDIEVAVVSIFVLVFPDNDVRSDNIGQPRAGDDIFFSFLPNVHSISLDIERWVRLLLDTSNFLWMFVLLFFFFQAWLSLNVF